MTHPFLHVWQHGGFLSEDTKRRNALARRSWENAYATGNWVERRLDDNVLTRNAANTIPGETKEWPFIKDILRYGCFAVPDDQIIVFTNADTVFSATITDRLTKLFADGAKAVHAHRRDFPKLDRLLMDDEIAQGAHYQGSDLFAFYASWWRAHAAEFPDMVMGAESWDHIMREMVKKYYGVELVNAIYHERHESFWEKPGNRENLPANRYGRTLARDWLRKNKLPLKELDFHEEPLRLK